MSAIMLKFAREALAATIKNGGELVDLEVAQKRIEICRNCDKLGIVEPLPMLEFEGCTMCGCPLATKPYMKNIFDIKTLSFTVVDCPLKRWVNI